MKEQTIHGLMSEIVSQAKELERIATMPLSEWAEEQKAKVDIDPKTGYISEYHRDNCTGCALCEPDRG